MITTDREAAEELVNRAWAGEIDLLGETLEAGDVLLFTTNRPVASLIRAAEPGCPVNHAALVLNAGGRGDSDGRPGVVVATWHCTASSLASGAIVSYDLGRIARRASNVVGLQVMRPQIGDVTPYVAAALKMYEDSASWQFNATGLVAICLGLLRRRPGQIPGFVHAVWSCAVAPHPEPQAMPNRPLLLPTGRVGLITCSEFVYRCFLGEPGAGNALGPVRQMGELDGPFGPRHAVRTVRQTRWGPRFVAWALARQLLPSLAMISDPDSTAWVTPAWLYNCPRLHLVAKWSRFGGLEDASELEPKVLASENV